MRWSTIIGLPVCLALLLVVLMHGSAQRKARQFTCVQTRASPGPKRTAGNWLRIRGPPIAYNLSNETFFSVLNLSGNEMKRKQKAYIPFDLRSRRRTTKGSESAKHDAEQRAHIPWEWAPTHGGLRQVTGRGLCEQLTRLGLQRVFFAGDSLQRDMFRSLVMLVRLDGTAVEADALFKKGNRTFKGRMACPAGPIELVFVETWYLGYSEIGCLLKHHCIDWMPSYSRSELPTLLVVSTGVHHLSLIEFKLFFNSWLESVIDAQNTMAAHRRCKDRIYYRTVAEGHPGCHKYLEPLKRPRRPFFLPYQWGSFESFNNGALRASKVAQKKGLHIEMLDVVPMTRLRGDGHIMIKRDGIERGKEDCLHYQLPGIPDWWNHLLMSELNAAGQSRA